MSPQIRDALKEIVGPDAILPPEEAGTWGWEGGGPDAVVAPTSPDELAHLLGRASEEGWRVLPAGSGSWLDGGGPAEAELVLTVSRLREMEEYEPGDLTFTAGAGLTVASLEEATGANGQWLPLDPPGSRKGSLGAIAAQGLAGPLRAGFGTPRDHILGLTLVSGDGRVLRWGGRVVKNVAGFDMTRLSIGSWGSLGVITSVSARLFPLPGTEVSLLFRGPDAASLLPAARALALSSLPLSAVEFLDPVGEGLTGHEEQGVSAPGSGGRAGLLVRLMGSELLVRAMEDRIRKDLSGTGEGAPDRFAGQESRSLHQELNAWEEGAGLVLRLALLPSELGVLLEEAKTLGADRLAAHAGAGIVRVAVESMPGGRGELEGWARTLSELRNRLEGSGGSLTISRGPRALVSEIGAWGVPGPERMILEGLKRELDPQLILAPGRFVV